MAIKKRNKFKIDEITLILIIALLAIAISINKYLDVPPEMEVEKITAMILDDHGISFANNGIVDENKLMEVQNMDYDELKKSLKAKNDFCIYIEDANGDILFSKGSSRVSVGGTYCT